MSLILPALLAGGSLLSGVIGARAQSRAVDAQTDASRAGIAEQRRQFDRTTAMTAPWREAGQDALGRLDWYARNNRNQGYNDQTTGVTNQFVNALQGAESRFASDTGAAGQQARAARNSALDAYDSESRANDDLFGWRTGVYTSNAERGRADALDTYEGRLSDARQGYDNIMAREFEADPGYQFRLQQGEKALNRGAAARGNVFSGATMQALNDFNSGLASQEYGNFDARRNRDATQSYDIDATQAGNLYSGEVSNVDQNFSRLYGRASDRYNNTANTAGNLYAGRVNNADSQYNRRYGRAGDLLQTRGQTAGAAYDAGMGAINADYGRMIDRQNMLSGIAGLGQSGTSQAITAGQNTANAMSNLYGNIGTAQAQGAVGQANNFNSTMNNMFGILGAGNNGMFGDSWPSWLGGSGSSGGGNWWSMA